MKKETLQAIALLLILLLFCLADTYSQAIDSFQRDNRWYYCTEKRGLPVRTFYPKDTLMFSSPSEGIYNVSDSLFKAVRKTKKTNNAYWAGEDTFNKPLLPAPEFKMYTKCRVYIYSKTNKPGIFQLKNKKGKTLITAKVKSFKKIYTGHLPNGNYPVYFNYQRVGCLERKLF